MKISKSELVKIDKEKQYTYELEYQEFNNYPYLKALRNITGDVVIYKDVLDNLKANVEIKGEMICPCAITLEDVEVPFTLHEEVNLAFEDLDDAYYVLNNLDLDDLIVSLVLPEVPIKVVKKAKIEYPSGDGWCVMTEESLQNKKTEDIDPRLAILKDYQFDEEE